MKIIYNKYFPFRSFHAMNILGIIFCRIDQGELSKTGQNHEYIHTLQQKEMLYVGFFLWYLVEWTIRLAICRNWMKAYYSLYFEREAYDNERNLNYRHTRKHFAWFRTYVRK